MREMIQTERDYVKSLEYIIEVIITMCASLKAYRPAVSLFIACNTYKFYLQRTIFRNLCGRTSRRLSEDRGT